jgi:hypothetical protein
MSGRIEGRIVNEPFAGNQCLAVDASGLGQVGGRHPKCIVNEASLPNLLARVR